MFLVADLFLGLLFCIGLVLVYRRAVRSVAIAGVARDLASAPAESDEEALKRFKLASDAVARRLSEKERAAAQSQKAAERLKKAMSR